MDNQTIEFEGRTYVNPQADVDTSNQFIDNLRQTQANDTNRINQDTYALGTQVPSNLGGLSGSEATFAERYQTPQTEQMIANLRTTTQQAALQQALENSLAQYKKRYNDAHRAYRKRMYNKQNSSGNEYKLPDGTVDVEEPKSEGTSSGYINSTPGKLTMQDPLGWVHIIDLATGEEETAWGGADGK